jgi:hypothetical protein
MLLAMGVAVPLALSHADKDVNVTHPVFPYIAARVWASMFLVLLGLPGVYFRQADVGGRFGLVAFLAAFAGTLLVGGISWFGNFVAPVLGEVIPDTIRAWDRHPPPRMALGVGLTFGLFSLGWLLMRHDARGVCVRAAPWRLLTAAGTTPSSDPYDGEGEERDAPRGQRLARARQSATAATGRRARLLEDAAASGVGGFGTGCAARLVGRVAVGDGADRAGVAIANIAGGAVAILSGRAIRRLRSGIRTRRRARIRARVGAGTPTRARIRARVGAGTPTRAGIRARRSIGTRTRSRIHTRVGAGFRTRIDLRIGRPAAARIDPPVGRCARVRLRACIDARACVGSAAGIDLASAWVRARAAVGAGVDPRIDPATGNGRALAHAGAVTDVVLRARIGVVAGRSHEAWRVRAAPVRRAVADVEVTLARWRIACDDRARIPLT